MIKILVARPKKPKSLIDISAPINSGILLPCGFSSSGDCLSKVRFKYFGPRSELWVQFGNTLKLCAYKNNNIVITDLLKNGELES